MTSEKPTQPVSVIMTVFNEAGNIEKVLDSLLDQSRPPAEVVIVDGGSSDDTYQIIQHWADRHPHFALKHLSQPGANISQGRNSAIRAASHDYIAATDAGVRLPKHWLEHLTDPFRQSETQVVAGFFRADPDPLSPFQIAMGATVLPARQDIKPEKFLPSSRSVAFTRQAWQTSGGYPEWLDYCEDLIFDLNLKKQGYQFVWQPQAVALFAPRRSLQSFFLQYYRYARGDGKADLFLKRHLLRYFIYLVVAPTLLLAARRRWWVWPVLTVGGLGYVGKAYRRLWCSFPEFHRLDSPGKLMALAWVPLIRATGDLAKMVGYPVGRRWRKKYFKSAS